MAAIKEALSAATAITATLDSLANSATAGRASSAVDNTTNLYEDALTGTKIVLASGTPANDKAVYLYAYALVDGTNYTEGVTGTDASFTIYSPTNLKLIGIVSTPTGGTTYYAGPFSVAAAFGGVLPAKWGIVVINYSGLALGTGNTLSYTGVSATVA